MTRVAHYCRGKSHYFVIATTGSYLNEIQLSDMPAERKFTFSVCSPSCSCTWALTLFQLSPSVAPSRSIDASTMPLELSSTRSFSSSPMILNVTRYLPGVDTYTLERGPSCLSTRITLCP